MHELTKVVVSNSCWQDMMAQLLSPALEPNELVLAVYGKSYRKLSGMGLFRSS